MTKSTSSYRLVNRQTGECPARGSKREMIRLAKLYGQAWAVYFQGIPVLVQDQVKA
jgi:hypothetical protein